MTASSTGWSITRRGAAAEHTAIVHALFLDSPHPRVQILIGEVPLASQNRTQCAFSLSADEAEAMAEQMKIAARWVRLAESERAKAEATP